jgi:hypothetical protein
MSIRFVRASLAFLLLGSVSCILAQTILAQTEPAIDSTVYFAFFREAAGHVVLPPKSKLPTLNGETTDLVPQSIQDAMGITDREAKAVVDAATGCDDEINALEASVRAVVFETRLRVANDEKPSDAVAEQLRNLESRRVQIIMSHVDNLKGSLDPARFRIIEDYIRSRQDDGVFFPAVHPKKL